jgi:hypothetical protein
MIPSRGTNALTDRCPRSRARSLATACYHTAIDRVSDRSRVSVRSAFSSRVALPSHRTIEGSPDAPDTIRTGDLCLRSAMSGPDAPSPKQTEASERIRCNASSVFLGHEKIPLPPLMSKCARTAVTVRGCTREPSGVRIDVGRRTAHTRPVEFCEVGGVVRYSRRGRNGRGELPISPSNPPSEELKSIPFVQRSPVQLTKHARSPAWDVRSFTS